MRTIAYVTILFIVTACIEQKGDYQVAPSQEKKEEDKESIHTERQPSTATIDCYKSGLGAGQTDYYNLPNVVSHGQKSGEVAWSSSTDPRLLGEGEQAIFQTDSKLSLRVLAFTSPGKGEDFEGNLCRYMAIPYTKLQFKIGVRHKGSNAYFDEFVFDNIDKSTCSDVHSFNVPSSNSEIVIDVLDVKWDYDCITYTEQGFPDVPQCPWAMVWEQECFEFAIQMATDFTKDIPPNDESGK